jgi:biopolymer transport protein TolQ
MPLTIHYLYLISADNGVTRMVMEAGTFVKVILLILLAFSVMAWAVIFHKYRTFKKVEDANRRFLRLFRSGKSIRDNYDRCVAVSHSPLSRMMKASFREFEAFKNVWEAEHGLDVLRQNVASILDMATTEEVSGLRRYLVFLAITSSVCPFFGLLGTVWGVMDAFIAIGVYGSANIQVVAPGVAEALITTVAGLGAAIPAVIAYNYFVSRLRRIMEVIDNFSIEFTNAAIHEVI